MKYYCIPTNIGMAAASNAFLTGTKVNVTTFVIGDGGGTEYEPTPEAINLKGQVWQGAITNAEVDPVSPNIINYTTLLPSNVGGFTMREMGIKDDTGRLIGIGNMPSTPKIKFEDGISDETELIFSLTISAPEAMKWSVDPTIIIASKKDIAKHNSAADAHSDLREHVATELSNKANCYNKIFTSGAITDIILANPKGSFRVDPGVTGMPPGFQSHWIVRTFTGYDGYLVAQVTDIGNVAKYEITYNNGSTPKWTDWRETAQTEVTELILLNGWKTAFTAYKNYAVRCGRLACINATIMNSVPVGTFEYEPFKLPYAPIGTMRGTATDEPGNIYQFEVGASRYVGWNKAIPANAIITMAFTYPCQN